MFERVRILTKLQLTNKTKKHEKNSLRVYRDLALKVLVVVLITVFVSLLLSLVKNILFIPVNDYFMIFILILTQVLSIVSAISRLTVDIYQSKDNQILLTLPAKNDEIFLSKLIVYYINEFRKNFYFLFPFLIAYGFTSKENFGYYISILFIIFILPFIIVSIAAFISILLTLITHYLKKHHWVTFGLTVLFIISVFILIYYLVSFIPDNIRIVQLYNSFIVGLTKFMQQVANFGFIYQAIGKLMTGSSIMINSLIIILTLGVLFLINYLFCRPLFFWLTSKSREHTKTKDHQIHDRKHKGLFWTFFRKELTIAKRSPNELLSNYVLLIALPLIIFVLNSIYMNMDRSSLGNQLILIFNILIILILITASNTASVVAITTEGFEFVLLKTAPSKTLQVAWAKMAFNFIITSILLLLSFVLFRIALPVFNRTDIWLMFIFAFLFNASQIFWSFQIDILNPKLSDYASTGSITDNDNIKKALGNGFLVSIAFTLLSIFVFLFFESIAWILLIIMMFIWLGFRFLSFNTYLKAYFVDIEY
ncbi:hypothetical protein ACAG96_00550 [Candidatus Izemoplasma sp. B36]|uniref:hypothetical protein n=1 Tax=Candidatus Izemoplasma sp. B36 TaxID=3242468 RepID=UPI003555E2BF